MYEVREETTVYRTERLEGLRESTPGNASATEVYLLGPIRGADSRSRITVDGSVHKGQR